MAATLTTIELDIADDVETLDALIAYLTEGYDIDATCVGTSNGWPIVAFTGCNAAIEVVKARYDA